MRRWVTAILVFVLCACAVVSFVPRAGLCYRCFSTETAPISYGLYMPSEGLDRALENHEFVLGGCVIELFSPSNYCFHCEKTFGFFMQYLFAIPAALAALALAVIWFMARRKAKTIETEHPHV